MEMCFGERASREPTGGCVGLVAGFGVLRRLIEPEVIMEVTIPYE